MGLRVEEWRKRASSERLEERVRLEKMMKKKKMEEDRLKLP